MKKTGILNAPLSRAIATMGHTDGLTVADAGLPVPEGPQRIDLALLPGMPPFLETLDAVMTELHVERAVCAEEIRDVSPEVLEAIRSRLGDVPLSFVPHEDFKGLTARGKAVVRTGECTPYANIILYSGVPF